MSKKGGINLKAIIVILLIVVVALTGGIIYYLQGLGAVDPDNKDDVTVTIPNGSGASSIVYILNDEGLIKNLTCARINAKFGGYDSLQANTYILNKSMTVTEMMNIINTGDFEYLSKSSFEMKEGCRLQQNAELLAQSIPYSAKEIMNVWNDKEYLHTLIDKYWFLTDEILNKDVMFPLEGYLYPDTYFITDDNPTIESVTEMMLDQMDTQLSSRRDQIEASGFTVNEFLSLASIVCKEGGSNEAEAPHIAGVFINRLKQGMSLGSDVTVCYIYQEDRVDLRESQLNSTSKYNTRKYAGLTPGPICAVPAIDMDAVLNYVKTDDLFFYAGPDGTVYYATTNEGHSKNVQEHPWTEEDLAQ